MTKLTEDVTLSLVCLLFSHRLGQKRNVEIVRFTMKDSVEGRIHKMLEKKYAGGEKDDHVEEVIQTKKGKRAITPLVGSIHNDRTAVLGEEFDVLFGVAEAKEEPKAAKEEPNAAAQMEVDPDEWDFLV